MMKTTMLKNGQELTSMLAKLSQQALSLEEMKMLIGGSDPGNIGSQDDPPVVIKED